MTRCLFALIFCYSLNLLAAEQSEAAAELKKIDAKVTPQRVMIANPDGQRQCLQFLSFKHEGQDLMVRQIKGNLDTEKDCQIFLLIDPKTKAAIIQRVEQNGTILFEQTQRIDEVKK